MSTLPPLHVPEPCRQSSLRTQAIRKLRGNGESIISSFVSPGLLDGTPGGESILESASYSDEMNHLERVTRDPAVMGGKPCLRGLRVTVGMVLGLLASGKSADEILALYPYLEADDIRAALEYAAWRTQETELPLS